MMADLDPIAPLIPTISPTKGKPERGKPGRVSEEPGPPEGDRKGPAKKRKPDGSTHEVDEYA